MSDSNNDLIQYILLNLKYVHAVISTKTFIIAIFPIMTSLTRNTHKIKHLNTVPSLF